MNPAAAILVTIVLAGLARFLYTMRDRGRRRTTPARVVKDAPDWEGVLFPLAGGGFLLQSRTLHQASWVGFAGSARGYAFWLLDDDGDVRESLRPRTACECELSFAFSYELRGESLVERIVRSDDMSNREPTVMEKERLSGVGMRLARGDPRAVALLDRGVRRTRTRTRTVE